MRGTLVVAEVALSLVLVAQAGLLLKSFMRVHALDPGFQVEGVWTVPLNPTGLASPEEYVLAMDRVEASLAGIPGVSSAGYSLTLPFEFTGSGRCCWMTTLSANFPWPPAGAKPHRRAVRSIRSPSVTIPSSALEQSSMPALSSAVPIPCR